MRKRFIHLVCITACIGTLLTGCGKEKDSDKEQNVPTEETSVTPTETPTEAPTEAPTEESEEVSKEDTEGGVEEGKEEKEESEEEPKEDAATDSELASEDFINFDKMQFFINGKAYILGKTTLKEMIDDGVPFDEEDLVNANNNINGNTQSQGFKIILGDYWSAQVYAMNDSTEDKITSDCIINEIYLPNHNEKTQDILSFEFPLTITEDELKGLAIKPSDVSEYKDGDYTNNTYEYKKDSTQYLSKYGYTFQFTKGKLSYFTMRFLK